MTSIKAIFLVQALTKIKLHYAGKAFNSTPPIHEQEDHKPTRWNLGCCQTKWERRLILMVPKISIGESKWLMQIPRYTSGGNVGLIRSRLVFVKGLDKSKSPLSLLLSANEAGLNFQSWRLAATRSAIMYFEWALWIPRDIWTVGCIVSL